MAKLIISAVIVAGCAAPAARIETGTPSTAAITTTVERQKAWVRCPCYAPPATTTTLDPVSLIPPTLRRIGGCESHGSPTAPLDWTAHNPHSSASGAFEELDSTWQGWEAQWGAERVGRALWADEAEQVRVAVAAYQHEGTRPWVSSEGCWAA